MVHFITGVDLHIGHPRARPRTWFQASRNWLYTAAHKTRRVIIGVESLEPRARGVPYWPRVCRVLLARRWFRRPPARLLLRSEAEGRFF